MKGPRDPPFPFGRGRASHGRLQRAEALSGVADCLALVSVAEAAPAKDRFTSLDTLALVRELRALGKAYVDKVFDSGPETWEIAFRVPGIGRRTLFLAPGRYAALLEGPRERSEELGALSRELRRHLAGAAVTAVAEPQGERYLELEAHRGDAPGPVRLITEFFGAGNLLLVREGKILAVAHPRTWAHRSLRPGAEYRPPPARPNPWNLGAAELRAALERSRTDRVRTLAAPLGFGGAVAEELLARSEIPGNVAAPEQSARVADDLRQAIQDLVSEIGERPAGFLTRRENVLLDVEPFRSRRWRHEEGVTEQSFPHFSQAADAYFRPLLPVAATPTEPDLAAGLRRQQEQQGEAIGELEGQVARLRAQADAIFAHYAEAEKIAEGAAGPERHAAILATLGGVAVPLLPGRPPRASAESLYAEMKRLQAKLAGAKEALGLTLTKLSEAEVGRQLRESPDRIRPATPRRPHWFERYRWFVSSEGIVVIGGRDAASNDFIVRRYLGARDIYFHADVHGAPSVIVKAPAPGATPPGDATLREAGQWAVSFSKAWRAGQASADAFWVPAEQVSKTAGTGEFVPRGAWVIHGTKHWLRDCPLELGLGPMDYERESLWTAAPPSALRARGRLRWILVPGEERERGDREVELSGELGLSREVLQRLLPAGGISARRV